MKKSSEKIFSLGALSTLLLVTPWATIDPINVPKFAVLAITGAISFVLLVKITQCFLVLITVR